MRLPGRSEGCFSDVRLLTADGDRHSRGSCSLTQVGLAQMRGHTAVCTKYQEYIEEGVRSTAKSQPTIIRYLPQVYCNNQFKLLIQSVSTVSSLLSE